MTTLITESGQTIREVNYPQDPAQVAAFLDQGAALSHPTVMMRRDAILALGGYRPAYRHAEDYDLWLRVAERHDLANLPDRLLWYRHHPGKASLQFAVEQSQATLVAQLEARARRAGRADPTEGLSALEIGDCVRLGPTRPDVIAMLKVALRWARRRHPVRAARWVWRAATSCPRAPFDVARIGLQQAARLAASSFRRTH